jgi:hypothetical protein
LDRSTLIMTRIPRQPRLANQSIVEVLKLVSGNPIFLKIIATDKMDSVLVEECLGNAKAGDITLAA